MQQPPRYTHQHARGVSATESIEGAHDKATRWCLTKNCFIANKPTAHDGYIHLNHNTRNHAGCVLRYHCSRPHLGNCGHRVFRPGYTHLELAINLTILYEHANIRAGRNATVHPPQTKPNTSAKCQGARGGGQECVTQTRSVARPRPEGSQCGACREQ